MKRIALIGAASIVLGLGWNALSGRGFPLRQSALASAEVPEITLLEAHARLDRGALFLDARAKDFYTFGHIPGALSLPESDFETAFPPLESKLRSAGNIIVYCDGFGCKASHEVARALAARGIAVSLIPEGFPGWQDAGYSVKTGEQP